MLMCGFSVPTTLNIYMGTCGDDGHSLLAAGVSLLASNKSLSVSHNRFTVVELNTKHLVRLEGDVLM